MEQAEHPSDLGQNADPAKIRVLVVEPRQAPYMKEISSGLASLQKEVGGYIEAVYPFEEPCALICNEEGKLNGLPLNRALRDEDGQIYDIIAGKFLVVGLGEENFESLSEEDARRFSKLYESPELFAQINGQLVVLPFNPQKANAERSSVLDKLKKMKQQEAPASKLHAPEKEVR